MIKIFISAFLILLFSSISLNTYACSLLGGEKALEKGYNKLKNSCQKAGGSWTRNKNQSYKTCYDKYISETNGYNIEGCLKNYCDCPKNKCWASQLGECIKYEVFKNLQNTKDKRTSERPKENS